MNGSAVTVSVRRRDGKVTEDHPWGGAPVDLLCSASPWRTFRWYKGQKHYSGTYWAATTQDHVIYESRLELSRLLFADFDCSVQDIVAQPFLLKAVVEGCLRKHIPDYLLLTKHGPLVVDVKPSRRLSHPVVEFTFAWTQRVVESRGWQYEVWSEPPNAEMENIRFLAGYRRPWLFAPELLDELLRVDLDGVRMDQASRCLPGQRESCVRSGIHHLLWTHSLTTDLAEPLRPSSVLRRAA